MSTTTQFKQKSCIKCNSNHNNDGVLCDFCKAKAEKALKNRPPTPDNYWVECLIEREGDTTVFMQNVPHVFRKNKQGHSVCEVVNHGHYNAFLKMPHLYAKYTPVVEEEPEQIAVAGTDNEVVVTVVPPIGDSQRSRLELIFSMGQPVITTNDLAPVLTIPSEQLPTLSELIQSLHEEGKSDTDIAEELGNSLTRQRVTKIRMEAGNAGKTPTR